MFWSIGFSAYANPLADELNAIRTYSVCAPDGVEETAVGWIKTQDRPFQPMILSRSMAMFGGVLYERAEVWYSDTITHVVPITVPMKGDVYYTLVPTIGDGPLEPFLFPF